MNFQVKHFHWWGAWARRAREPAPDGHAAEIDRGLSKLAGMLPREGWELGGGVALDLLLGGITRKHGDFDLCVDAAFLPEIVAHTATQGYALRTRRFWGRISPSRIVVISSDADLPATRPESLHRLFLQRIDRHAGPAFLASLDVSVYARAAGQLVRSDGKVRIPAAWWRWGRGGTSDQHAVPLSHPLHLLAIKQRRRHPSDVADRIRLERWLTAHPELDPVKIAPGSRDET